MPEYAGEAIERELTAIQNIYSRFKSQRQDIWDKLLRREYALTIQPELRGSVEAVEYRSPDLESAAFKHTAVLQMNPTAFDIAIMTEGERAKGWGRDILLWAGATWMDMNKGRWWDQAVGWGQVTDGVKVTRLRALPLKEPEVDEKRYPSGADYMRERDRRMRQAKLPFELVDCQTLGASWTPVDERDIDAVWYEAKIGYIEAQERLQKEGKRPTLDTAGKLGWLNKDEVKDTGDTWDKEFRLIVRDARDPKNRKCPVENHDHFQRVITEYLCGDGDGIKDAEVLDTYDSPFHKASFIVTAGQVTASRNPHDRYRPLLYPHYVETVWFNYLRTVLATVSRRDSGQRFYISLKNVPPHVQLPEGGEPMEMPLSDPDGTKIPYTWGEVMAFPSQLAPAFIELLTESRERLQKVEPSPFVTDTGEAPPTDTATVFLESKQQAMLPYNPLLTASDASIDLIFDLMFHAIQFWDATSPEGTERKFFAAASGRESFVSTEAQPGEQVYISSQKISEIDFKLVLNTGAETLAVEGQKWALAKDKYATGIMDPDQLIREGGYRDVEGQKKKLFAAKLAGFMEPQEMMMAQQAVMTLMQAITGIEFALPGQSAPPMLGQGEGQPMGEESVTSMTGRFMQPAAIEGVQGGADPVGGQM